MDGLLLDPWILSYNHDEGPETYVAELLAVFDLSQEFCVDVQVTARAVELLEVDEVYPFRSGLPEELWPKRADVLRLFTGILDRADKIEDQGISAVLCEDVLTSPVLPPSLSDSHREHLHELMVIAAVRNELAGDSFSLHSTSAPCAAFSLETEVVEVDAGGRAPRLGRYAATVHVFSQLVVFYRFLDPLCLALGGFIVEAICLAVWKCNADVCDPFRSERLGVGRDFARTVGRTGLLNNPAQMNAMIRAAKCVVLGEKLRTTHALRSGAGPEEEQIVRKSDGASAWRVDINDELHLHYWKRGKFVEFANVGFHNDFYIAP